MGILLLTKQQCSESGNAPEENSYEVLDCYYSSPEDAKARLSHLLEKVNHKFNYEYQIYNIV
jgi:hypothetical protein